MFAINCEAEQFVVFGRIRVRTHNSVSKGPSATVLGSNTRGHLQVFFTLVLTAESCFIGMRGSCCKLGLDSSVADVCLNNLAGFQYI